MSLLTDLRCFNPELVTKKKRVLKYSVTVDVWSLERHLESNVSKQYIFVIYVHEISLSFKTPLLRLIYTNLLKLHYSISDRLNSILCTIKSGSVIFF